jgi:cyanuric acid amidohydrolase
VNDFSRTLSSSVWKSHIPEDAISIFSGGTEGVLSPHVTVIVSDPGSSGLQAFAHRTRALKHHEIGQITQTTVVAEAVEDVMIANGLAKEDVKLVLIKCPLLTSTKIEIIRDNGFPLITSDTYESMAMSRQASALGIGMALKEVSFENAAKRPVPQHIFSTRASCSSGAELDDCQILILTSTASGKLRAIYDRMKHAIDGQVLLDMVHSIQKEGGSIVQVFAKAEADPTGLVGDKRHTMVRRLFVHCLSMLKFFE